MRSFLARQFRSLAPMFRPPFDGLWIVVLLYFVWCFFVRPDSQILRGDLPDPDDYMYLTQVLDWLKGQNWFDNIQHRLDPPAGVAIPFSRLPQIPMAAVIWLFERLGLPPHGAATLMAVFEPLFLLAGFFAALRWMAASLMPKDWAGVTAYVALFASGLMGLFNPGHVDHHGLDLLLVTLALGCSLRMMEKPDEPRWGASAGFFMAFAVAISLETLPCLLLISGWIGLWTMARGGAAARIGLIYGLTLLLASAGFLLLARPPDDLLTPDMLTYSIVYVTLMGSIAVPFAGILLTAQARPAWRWLAGVILAAAAGLLFLKHFPVFVAGPYGAMDPALAKLIMDDLSESMALVKLEKSWLRIAARTAYGFLALGAGLWFLRRMPAAERWRWMLIVLPLAAAIVMAIFYQSRFVGLMSMLAVVPLASFLQRGWAWLGTHERGRRKVWAEIGLLLLVGPLPGVLIPAVVDGRSFNVGVFLFPASGYGREPCDMYGLEQVLRAPVLYGGKPRLIMNTMGSGPELLFRTQDMVLSAPYHTSVAGNLDSVRFFAATDPAEAEAIARRRHVDLVVSCLAIPGLYGDLTKIRATLAVDEQNAKAAKTTGKLSPPMILRLITGRYLPPWLVPVHSPVLRNYVVYEILPSAFARKFPEHQ